MKTPLNSIELQKKGENKRKIEEKWRKIEEKKNDEKCVD